MISNIMLYLNKKTNV